MVREFCSRRWLNPFVQAEHLDPVTRLMVKVDFRIQDNFMVDH